MPAEHISTKAGAIPTVVRDYIHISDAAASLVALAQVSDTGGHYIFNIGSGVGHSLNEIVIEIENLLNRRLTVEYTAARTFDVPVSVLSIDRARQLLGWKPLLSFSVGLRGMHTDVKAGLKFSTIHL